jgi:hypothetical protein
MTSITLTATVTEDRHLELDLPREVPVGPVEVVIKPLAVEVAEEPEITRDEIRSRLKAAGLLSEGRCAPMDAVPLSDDEREELGRLFAGPRLISDLIDEDRGPR